MPPKKIKFSDLATELHLTPEILAQRISEAGIKVSPRVKTLSEEQAEALRQYVQKKGVSLTEVRKGDIVEKRVQTSVIRRRKVELPPAAPETATKEAPKSVAPAKAPEKVPAKPSEETKPSARVKPKINVIVEEKQKPAPVLSEEELVKQKEKAAIQKALVEEEELAKKRRKAFIQKRSEEFDIHGFNRAERIYQPKKKKATVIDRSKMQATQITVPKASKRVIKMSGQITVTDLAAQLKAKTGEVIKKLMQMGTMVTANQSVDVVAATVIAQGYDYEVQNEVITESDILKREAPEPQALKLRPPVVTIMGHVDHGKTTLLDAIRKSDVALGEAGGITQHIGAYMVDVGNNRTITFIDTPGHEAFSAMRARGAKTTDIVILVVAADDGIMPQTKEAIAHAREANVPIMVALNKIDKPGVQIDRVKKQLADLDLLAEDWGGKTVVAPVSAKANKGIKELLELILLQADILELKASPDQLAEGVVLEAKVARGLGPVATVLIQQGILKKGDVLVAGTVFGKVRLLIDDRGRQLKEALPSFAVEVSGLENVPQAGDHFYCFKNEQEARKLTDLRIQKQKQEEQKPEAEKITLEGLYAKMQEGEVQELKVIVKADVQGSVEVIKQTIEKLSTPQVRMNVIYTAAGAVSESDVNLAAASGAVIIGFNIRPDPKAQELAKAQKVDIKLYSIIYEVIDDLKKAMLGKLEPKTQEIVLGRAEVRNVFKVSKVGTVAGCAVVSGKVTRTCKVRLLRDSVVIFTGKVASLKRFKDDAKEVLQGYECGIGLENYNDVKEGDVIEAFIVEEVAPTLPS